jgi:hypothetical protein
MFPMVARQNIADTAREAAKMAETECGCGGGYVNFGILLAQGPVNRVQSQISVERNRRCSSEAPKLTTQSSFGCAAGSGNCANTKRHCEMIAHVLNRLSNGPGNS